MTFRLKILLFFALSLVCIGCDQVTKNLAKQNLMNKEPASYFHDFFRLEYVENTGAALSVGDSLPQPYNFLLLSVIPLITLVLMFGYILYKIRELSVMRILAFALIFAGGIGNIIDRVLFDRHVTDFMNVGILSLRTGIFNVADVCISTGVICLLLSYKSDDRTLKTA